MLSRIKAKSRQRSSVGYQTSSRHTAWAQSATASRRKRSSVGCNHPGCCRPRLCENSEIACKRRIWSEFLPSAEPVMAENGRIPAEIHKLPPGHSSFHTAWTLRRPSPSGTQTAKSCGYRTFHATVLLCDDHAGQRQPGAGSALGARYLMIATAFVRRGV